MKKKLAILLVVLIVIGVFLSACINRFFSINGVKPGEYLYESTSPDGSYTITTYLNNGGATTAFAVLCTVTDNSTDKTRNIYFNYRGEGAKVEWIDNDTAVINGVSLDVENEYYYWPDDENWDRDWYDQYR